MEPIEITARRSALGLNQADFAHLLGVKQATISHWETGKRNPNNPDRLTGEIAQFERLHQQIVDETLQILRNVLDSKEDTLVFVATFADDEDYWEVDAQAKQLTLPAAFHRSATAQAAQEAEAEYGVRVEIRETRTRSTISKEIADIKELQSDLDLEDPEELFQFDILDAERLELEEELKNLY
ncbi:putative zinc finger/helix-turn-helix protein%2C YgiT family [Chlamydia trachomatis]|nr:putative zinc finger/helix-turn-helix protein%2C YgiT family [Chlamydia trachomatis]